MEITFEQTYLEELYLKGKCSDKKHRFQPQVISKYRKTIDLMEYAVALALAFAIIPLVEIVKAIERAIDKRKAKK